MDSANLRTGEIVASLGGLALFILLFLDWIGAEGSDEGVSGWEYLGTDVTGFVVFLACVTAGMLGLLALLGRRNPLFGAPWGGPTTVLGVLAFDIVLWRMLTVPDGGELSAGIFLGLLAAAGVAAGGYLTLLDGGRDPLRIGGRSSAAAPTRKAPATKKAAAKRKPAAKRRAASRSSR